MTERRYEGVNFINDPNDSRLVIRPPDDVTSIILNLAQMVDFTQDLLLGSGGDIQKVTIRLTAAQVNAQATIVGGGNSAIAAFFHLSPGQMLVDATVVVRQAFNDSGLAGAGPFTIENVTNDQIIVATGAMPDTVNAGAPTLNGGYEGSTPFVAGPLGYDLLLNFNGVNNGDGTTGIADVYLLVI